MDGKYHVRSISLPASSHPTSIRVEQELNSLKLLQEGSSTNNTATSVCSGLLGLEKLYNCVNEFLALQSTEAVMLTCKSEQWVGVLFDASVKILDVCSNSRDAISQVKLRVQELQSALRRRKGDSSIEKSLSNYKSFRKSLKKDATKMIAGLRKFDTKIRASAVNSLDIDCSRLVRVLTEATTMAISLFESLLTFLGAPSSTTKWSLAQRLMSTRVASCDKEILNEFSYPEAAAFLVERNSSEVNSDAVKRLATLEISVGDLEDCLEKMFRCLVRSRVSLLNFMSH